MRAKLLILALILTTFALSGTALAQDPIVHYPLESNPIDVTGNNGIFQYGNFPTFVDGGLYVNGVYAGLTCITPELNNFDRTLFTFSVEFKIDEYPTGVTGDGVMPVMWLGRSWRSLGFEIDADGYAGIRTGSAGDFIPSSVQVSLNEWHTARVSWNESMLFASCYLDGELIMLAERGAISTSADMKLTPCFYANGHVFKGVIKNLMAWNSDNPEIVATESSTWDLMKSLYR